MSGGITKIFIIIFFISLIFIPLNVSALPPGLCIPENNTFALGIFAPQESPSGEEQVVLEEINAFRQATGKKPAIGILSDEWMNDRLFPIEGLTTIRNEGMTPYVRLMMRSSEKPYQQEPLFTLQNIAQGKFDGELRAWARQARSFGSPLFIEYGTEVNQWNYPWNGYWNRNEYGQSLFRDAYRHIITIMKEEGASNLIWVYHLNAESRPDESWNNGTAYYPGDEFCDFIAVSLYGTQKPFETEKKQFKVTMESVMEELNASAIHKPILVITGTDVHNQFVDPTAWVTDVISSIKEYTWPEVKGIIWYNAAWKNDNNPLHDSSMRLQDNSAVSDAIKSALVDIGVKEKFTC